MPKPIPTEQQIDEAWALANAVVDSLNFHREYIIDDYPIGRGKRGKCALRVDWHRHRGWRTNRITTNEKGFWCKPKTGTFQDEPITVVAGVLRVENEITGGWLMMCQRVGPYIQRANYDRQMLCEPPCYFEPQRTKRAYGVSVNGGPPESKVIFADDPALCDAWERWHDHYKLLYAKVLAFRDGK